MDTSPDWFQHSMMNTSAEYKEVPHGTNYRICDNATEEAINSDDLPMK
ncbi:hypothetical protein [Xenorhabdus innexi]|uniref:Uncharacterized protein n=1 Tax=Xenorhabdus innexi TaxID=290109 RepID=A0A2G0NMP6_9GAMM|nr:hypothetical protein [Xenorhabdus innexi]PHM36004.1 hypothetical protein Xinn_01892 [Xenorhabdus innexi]